MDESSSFTIEYINQLKRESEKIGKWLIALVLVTFFVPFSILIFSASVFRSAPNDENTVVHAILGGFFLLPVVFITLTAALIVVIIMAAKRRSKYRAAYKRFFSHRVLTELLKEYYYDHTSGISQADLSTIGMVRFGNEYHSEDYVSGRYRDVGFAQADVLIQNVTTDSDGHTQTDTYFGGTWMVFEFPRRFVAKLAVVGRGCREAVYAKGMEKFATESNDFNKKFKVYMQDGVEMFYLLDPKMIEAMQTLGEKFSGKIMFLFADKKLHIGLNNGADSFEPPKNKKGDLDTVEEIERLSKEFNTVFQLIDTLELNKNIFKQD